ncbi:MAG: S8 family serine peptidase [Lachnospiraceae bacterium]|nr:S8 family serine peptidase [Lachnospiraceae bacterium]
MKRSSKWKKALALVLAFSLVSMQPGSTLFASEAGSPEEPILLEQEIGEAVMSAGEDVSDDALEDAGALAMIKEAVSFELKEEADELKAYKAGEDYVEHQAFFSAESREEAEKVAAEYGAVLDSYGDGVAVIRFEETVQQVMSQAASIKSATKAIQPDYIVHALEAPKVQYVKIPQNAPKAEIEKLNESFGVSSLGLGAFFTENVGTYGITEYYTDPHVIDNWQWYHDVIGDTYAYENRVTGKGIKVAVIDTGINPDHEDLEHYDGKGYDFVNSDSDPTDDNGHGSHCAGIIGATGNNGCGGVGIAPEAKLTAYKVLAEDGRGMTSNIVKAVNRAVQDGADVISMSLGGGGASSDFQKAINNARQKGCVVVAAAGNENTDTKSYPAAYDNVIAVAASDHDGNLSWFSNFGNWVDVVAPGGNATSQGAPTEQRAYDNIFSCYYEDSSSYYCMSGTSMACPVVAGLVALLMSANDQLQSGKPAAVDAISSIIIGTTDGKEYKSDYGTMTGMIQAEPAVRAALEGNIPTISSNNIAIANPAGFIGAGSISKGGSLQLKLVDQDTGNVLKASKAKWKSSNTDDITVQNGKIKCTSDAFTGASSTITATLEDGGTATFEATVVPKFSQFGIWRTYPLVEGGNVRVQNKLGYTSQLVYGSTYTEYTLLNPSSLVSSYGNLYLWYQTGKTSYRGTMANNTFKYRVIVPKKNVAVASVQENGDPASIYFKKPGTYTIKFKTTDGSNKVFSVKFKVFSF